MQYLNKIIINKMSSLILEQKKRGAFIVFEGIDRCGKSSQVELLTNSLKNNNINVENIRFPDRTSCIGQLINSYLLNATNMSDQAIHLLFSANRWEAIESIRERLESGRNLICDRYAHSGVSFSSAKGLDTHWCVSCDSGLIRPDAIIFLDLSVDQAVKRGEFGAERYEKKEFQEKVRESFFKLKELDEKTSLKWFIIDANKTKEQLHNELLNLVNNIIKDVEHKPLELLWT